MDRHSVFLNLNLVERLKFIWPEKEDYIYYVLLAQRFPILQQPYNVPLDEFGPEIYRMNGQQTLLLVLDRVYDKGNEWILIVSSEWLFTHKKNTLPHWILGTCLKNYTRFARNELCLESFRRPLI